jgi:hypothetical protein
MDTLPGYLWRDVLELSPRVHVVAWGYASHHTAHALQNHTRQKSCLRRRTIYGEYRPLSFLRLCDAVLCRRHYHAPCSEIMLWATERAYMPALHFFRAWGTAIVRKDMMPCDSAVVSACAHAMIFAASFGHVQVIQFLRDWAFELTGTHYTIDTMPASQMVHDAVRHGHVQVLEYLQDLGFKPTDSALEFDILPAAICNGHVSVLQHFKSHMDIIIRVIDRNDLFHNVLTAVVSRGHVSMLQLLRQWGVTVSHLRVDHNRVLSAATRSGNIAIWRMFKDWQDTQIIWPEEAGFFRNGNLNRHTPLLEDGGSDCLTVQDLRRDDNALLALAAEHGNLDMLRFFRDWTDANGDQLTMEDVRTRDNTPLWYAASRGHVEACRLLRDWRWTIPPPVNTLQGFPDRLTTVDAIFCLHFSTPDLRPKLVHTLHQVFDFMDAVNKPTDIRPLGSATVAGQSCHCQ